MTELSPDLASALQARFGARFSQGMAVCEQHGRDESIFKVPPPAAVVFAESTQDVQDAVRLCAAHRAPVIAYGAGSSVEGHLLAVRGGVSLDVVRHAGLFFPIDPGANASLGGMCATRASGTNAVRYGTMRDNALALQVVTPQGEVIRTGTRAKKSSAGYDLTRLYVGSEGTLGVITEITLRLYPLPEAVTAAICTFASLQDAVQTVIKTIQLGVPIARVELIDAHSVGLINAYSKTSLRQAHMLLMEFHGSPASVREQAETVQAIAHEHQGNDFEWASAPEERRRLWAARHNAYFAAVSSRPGCRSISTDVCVPISRLADCLLQSVDEVNASGIPYFLVGHVGDGNFHFGYLIDPDDASERERAEQLNCQLVARAIGMGGTCSGEHGVGLHKMDFLEQEAGEGALDVMRAIKQALDPLNIMNPGKIFQLQG